MVSRAKILFWVDWWHFQEHSETFSWRKLTFFGFFRRKSSLDLSFQDSDFRDFLNFLKICGLKKIFGFIFDPESVINRKNSKSRYKTNRIPRLWSAFIQIWKIFKIDKKADFVGFFFRCPKKIVRFYFFCWKCHKSIELEE